MDRKTEDLDFLIEMFELEPADRLAADIASGVKSLEKLVETSILETLLKGEFDNGNAILTVHSGAGGTEAQDWADMLYRMYTKYCNSRGYTTEVLDYQEGDMAGIKGVTLRVTGDKAYGYLKAERGVHRLVRHSPFDANNKRHTSFASIEVMPELEQDTDIIINPDDLRIDTYRSSGAGGQHVNKTDSAVRITHIPTGIVAACQNERSQIQNRETAMKMLKAKLLIKKEEENQKNRDEIQGELKKIEWGSQIRSYVFDESRIKDHRTGYESFNVTGVMNGDIHDFILEYLKRSV